MIELNFTGFLDNTLKQLKEMEVQEIQLDFKNVGSNIFIFRNLASYFAFYIRELESYDALSYFLIDDVNVLEVENFKKFLTKNSKLKDEFDEVFKRKLKEIFGSSSTLLEINNTLLKIGQKYQEHFMANLNEISFTDKTKPIQPYFEEHPEILSFFLSLGLPDKDRQEVFAHFFELYKTNFIALNLIEDKLFAYLATVYALNEIIKMLAYILPKLMVME